MPQKTGVTLPLNAFWLWIITYWMLKPELNTFDCYGDTFKISMVGRFLTNWKEVIRLSFIIRRYLYLSHAWKIHPGRFPSTYSSIKYNKIQIGTELALLIYSTTETITGFYFVLIMSLNKAVVISGNSNHFCATVTR